MNYRIRSYTERLEEPNYDHIDADALADQPSCFSRVSRLRMRNFVVALLCKMNYFTNDNTTSGYETDSGDCG